MRAFLAGLEDRPADPRALERVRFALASLQSPDVRYLVARIGGPKAGGVARAARAVLQAAGARTGVLGQGLEGIELEGAAVDDGLLARAGTMATSAFYQIGTTEQHLGEPARREFIVLLGLVAFAEAGQRVGLLLDPEVDAADPVHGPRPDLVVIGPAPGEVLRRAAALVADGGAAVVAGEEAAEVAAALEARGVRVLAAGRDVRVMPVGDELEVVVRGEPYTRAPAVPGSDPEVLTAGVATAFALGAMGIRMREDWVRQGLAALREVGAPA